MILSDCKKSLVGKDYPGTLAKTKTGKDCQAWNTNTPHATNGAAKIGANYPEGNVDDANNYCRNPDSDNGGPWCYTTNALVGWEYCDIKLCPGNNYILLYPHILIINLFLRKFIAVYVFTNC